MNKKLNHGQWQQVEEDIAQDILTGRLGPMAQLPKEPDLMQRFGVGRHTIRRAIANLRDRGLVRVEQGKGTFVREGRLQYRLSERTRFSQNLIEQGREPFGESIFEEEIPASPEVARALRLPSGEPVYHIIWRAFADREPVNISHGYYPAKRFPGLDVARRNGRSLSLLLIEYGVSDYIRLRTDLIVRAPTSEESKYLDLSLGEPVIVSKKVDVDTSGVPITYSETAWSGYKVQFSLDNTSKLLDQFANKALLDNSSQRNGAL